MVVMDDWTLLRAFAEDGSEAAFAEIVRRHTSFVYSAALRQTRSSALAEEVTQSVFIVLARKAGSVCRGTILSGWLYRAARFASLDAFKAELRRKLREEASVEEHRDVEGSCNSVDEARWMEMGPLLDELMAKLSEKDR